MPDRRTLDPEAFETLERTLAEDKVLSNAFRLMRDATTLFDVGGYASTVGLASIALEEIGKHLLQAWSSRDPLFSYDKRRLHVMKQCAVAALFLTDSVLLECKTRNVRFAELDDAENAKELARAVQAGLDREKVFANAARHKVLEVVKWNGLYYDDSYAAIGLEPEKVTEDHARSIMQTLSKAFMILAEHNTPSIAVYAFPFFFKTSLSLPRH